MTIEAIQYLDSICGNASRGDVIEEWIRQHRLRKEAPHKCILDEEEKETLISTALYADFEIALDAYSDVFLEPLKYEAQNGRDIDRLIEPFIGIVEGQFGKRTDPNKVRAFFREKLEVLSTTD